MADSTGTGSGSVATTFSAQDHTFDFLAVGQTLTVTYNVTVADGHGGTSTQPLTVTITGTNDAPVIATDAGGHAVTEQAGQLGSASADTASASLTFADADLSDTHSMSVSAALAVWSGGATPAERRAGRAQQRGPGHADPTARVPAQARWPCRSRRPTRPSISWRQAKPCR